MDLLDSYNRQRTNVKESDTAMVSFIRRTALGISVEDLSKSEFHADLDLEEPEVNNIGQKSYKVAEIDSIIKRYFVNLSIHEAINSLSQLGLSNFHGFFVKRIITLAISGSDKDKECTSKLLSAMYGNIVTAREVYEGYAMLLDCLESLGKENRNAMQCVAFFVARAILDDILPPSFITRSREWFKDAPEASHTLDLAEVICASANSRAIILENGWSCELQLKVTILLNFLKKIEAGSIVNHYFKSGDIELAIEKLGSIKMPSYDFVFVDRLLSLTGSFKQVKLTFDLLSLLLESRFSKRAVINGFVLLMISIKELAVDLDVHSVQYILLFVMAVHEGLLFPEDLVDIYRMIPSFCYGRRVIEEAAAILRVPLLESHSEFAGTYLFVSYHHQRSNVSMSDNDLAMTKIDPRAASYHRASCIRRTALGIPVEDPSKSQFNADLEEPEVNNIGQKSYKVAEVDSIIKRYFVNLSIHEAINSLSQLGLSNFHGFFIKRIITEAISGSNKDKECTSKLLSAMYGNIVTAREVYEGYAMLLDCLESLGKENRNAMQWVAVFVARGIVDDILPVSFISRSRGWLKDAPEACHALDMAELICSSPSSRAIIFENGWNCAYLLKDAILSNFLKKVIIQNMLKQCEDRLLITTSHKAYGLSMCDRLSIYQIEAGSIVNHYFKSGDIELAIEKLGSIKMPSYDFVFVERLLSLTGSLKQVKLTFDLLSLLLESRFSKLAVINGFVMLMISIKELALDLDVLFVKYLLLFVTAVLEGLLTPEDLVNIYGMIPSVCYGRIVIEEAAAILRVCLLPKIW